MVLLWSNGVSLLLFQPLHVLAVQRDTLRTAEQVGYNVEEKPALFLYLPRRTLQMDEGQLEVVFLQMVRFLHEDDPRY